MISNLLINRVLAATPSDIKLPNTDPNFNWAGVGLDSAVKYVTEFSNVALDIAAIIGIAMILYSSFLYISSFGEEAKSETAKKTMLWAIIGTVVCVAARFIINLLGNLLSKS
jgi:hypothetical protein